MYLLNDFNFTLILGTKMKNKLILAVIITISLLILIVSCQQSKEELINHSADNYSILTNSSIYALIMNTGAIHNQGVEYILQNWDTSNVFDGYNYFQDFWTISNVFSYQIQGWDSLYFDENNKNLLLDVFSNSSTNSRIQFLIDSIKNSTFWGQTITSQETQIINDALSFLNSDFTNYTSDDMFNEIINYADSSLFVWEQISWPNDSLGSGCVSGGCLNVMKSSAQYWKNNLDTLYLTNDTTSSEVPNFIGIGLVYGDTSGYILGWVNAVKNELNANGKLNINNQTKRINAGLEGAINFSTIGFLKYKFPW